MTLLEAIPLRHSVRRYTDRPLPPESVEILRREALKASQSCGVDFQLVVDEPKAYSGIMSYGKFSGVRNYIVVGAPRGARYDELAGYYGERLVLFAQTLGLNTCWTGLSYRKVKEAWSLRHGDRIVCLIALGYGETQGKPHKIKGVEQVSNAGPDTPEWFRSGVEAALLAPTAINQQKFYFTYHADGRVAAEPRFSLAGYTHVDLGIARLHFDLATANR